MFENNFFIQTRVAGLKKIFNVQRIRICFFFVARFILNRNFILGQPLGKFFFFIFFIIIFLQGYPSVIYSKEASRGNLPIIASPDSLLDEDISEEDWAIIENWEILENLDFLKEDKEDLEILEELEEENHGD